MTGALQLATDETRVFIHLNNLSIQIIILIFCIKFLSVTNHIVSILLIINQIMAENLQIDNLDRKILDIITKNARIPYLEVARECGVSGAAIHQRVQRLIKYRSNKRL